MPVIHTIFFPACQPYNIHTVFFTLATQKKHIQSNHTSQSHSPIIPTDHVCLPLTQFDPPPLPVAIYTCMYRWYNSITHLCQQHMHKISYNRNHIIHKSLYTTIAIISSTNLYILQSQSYSPIRWYCGTKILTESTIKYTNTHRRTYPPTTHTHKHTYSPTHPHTNLTIMQWRAEIWWCPRSTSWRWCPKAVSQYTLLNWMPISGIDNQGPTRSPDATAFMHWSQILKPHCQKLRKSCCKSEYYKCSPNRARQPVPM